MALAPSSLRRSRICRATSWPTATPCRARPGGDARQVLGQGRVEDGLPGRVQGGQGVVGRLGGGRLLRGAARGVDVGVVGLVRPVDGVDGVEHGDVDQRHVAGQGDPGRLAGQRLQQESRSSGGPRWRTAGSGPPAIRAAGGTRPGGRPPGPGEAEGRTAGRPGSSGASSDSPFRVRSAVHWGDNAVGADRRRGGAGPVGACLAVRTPPAAFLLYCLVAEAPQPLPQPSGWSRRLPRPADQTRSPRRRRTVVRRMPLVEKEDRKRLLTGQRDMDRTGVRNLTGQRDGLRVAELASLGMARNRPSGGRFDAPSSPP